MQIQTDLESLNMNVVSDSSGLEKRTHGCCQKIRVPKTGSVTERGAGARTGTKVA
jgi:hypothetical protein